LLSSVRLSIASATAAWRSRRAARMRLGAMGCGTPLPVPFLAEGTGSGVPQPMPPIPLANAAHIDAGTFLDFRMKIPSHKQDAGLENEVNGLTTPGGDDPPGNSVFRNDLAARYYPPAEAREPFLV
jgi:hypothetical protein